MSKGIEVGYSSFRVRGKHVDVLFGREWLNIWKIIIVENNKDLALDVDVKNDSIKVVKRNSPQIEGTSRYISNNDFVLFNLENGKTLTIELTSHVNTMLKELAKHGVKWNKGSNVERNTPFKEEQ